MSDLGIKLENTKYELNRLQREHIKLQLEQEKHLDREEKLVNQLKELEDETIASKEELGKLKKNWEEDVMDRKKTEQVCKVCLLRYIL